MGCPLHYEVQAGCGLCPDAPPLNGHVHIGESILNCPICDPAGAVIQRRRAALDLTKRLKEDATLAMTIVKNEANDSLPFPGATSTWTVEDGAARFLEVMLDKGWAFQRTGT
jgi:hypothetical protein